MVMAVGGGGSASQSLVVSVVGRYIRRPEVCERGEVKGKGEGEGKKRPEVARSPSRG